MTAVPTLVSPARQARAEALDVLVRCWLRETGTPVPGPGPVRVDLPATGRALVVDVVRRSPSGRHDLGAVTTPDGAALDVDAVAGWLTAEAAARAGLPAGHGEDARARITESADRAAGYAVLRAAEPEPPKGLPPWLAAEQGLLAGHPWHPMTKSRDGLPDAEDATYAPEARGHFPLHWFAARREVVATGSAAGDVPALLHRLAGDLEVPRGFLPVPAHPWQAARLAARPGAAALLERGDLVDLGPAGPPWWATSSLRTVARPDVAVMLKLSLGLRVTNSRRENLRGELRLGVRTAELVDAGLGAALAAAHPHFGLVRDPAWVGVDGPEGPVGLDTVVRDQPFRAADRVACAGAVVDARPDRGRPPAADLVHALASRTGLPVPRAAALWYRRWLHAVAVPLLWLHGRWGIGLEAHLQNVLVGLDGDGLPDRGWYRDNQGWYAAASRVPQLRTLLPGIGGDTGLVFDDALVTDRVVYYLGVNNLIGCAAALAGAGLADEADLLGVLADVLRDHLAGPTPSPAAALLLEADRLPVKANLLTGVDGRDELDGPVAAQSVYVQIPNPLREVLP
ncbi:IucA/IucC family siderophore biosynthesis protein [Geodermatophilus sp. DSM 45219]|uniref:IucA/IucC family protein n=1 Tax=Geodermatophilus sp. DSM 45219 TaxID=1881103 RepID=UPI00088787D7|nr:IucA/IucC family protein [Geodermatophilus sp. DSM 45219]SDN74632.1 Siderophore synthetase component [Geodermatophilus sp. DSM 45219]